jgi:putative CocE/NonD family hydrolase
LDYRVLKDVMVPLRDGVRLATDVWIPEGTKPAPAILTRTPYSKDNSAFYAPGIVAEPFALVQQGYVVVWQDCRGTYRSEGEYAELAHEALDGVDTVGWIREQAWCDGSIGTCGASYLGFTQWVLAAQGPEGLRAIAPTITSSDHHEAFYSVGGAFSLWLAWSWSAFMALGAAQRALGAGTGSPESVARVSQMMADRGACLATLPVGEILAHDVPWWRGWIDHPDRDDHWRRQFTADRSSQVQVPALHIGGWFDYWVNQTVRSFCGLRRGGRSAEAREGQQLVIGPWNHVNFTGVYRDREFGPNGHVLSADVNGRHTKFYDRWLRGRTDALEGIAPVRIFVMGIDEWRDEDTWPLPDTRYVDYYLDSSGRAHTADGDGTLSTEAPERESADVYLYDPKRPVPTIGGRMGPPALFADGPVDQRPVERRQDVLCFSTETLVEPVEVTGHISLVLHVASSARDTDFTGKLVDVFPDGRAIFLTDGIVRARYRNSLSEPELLEPGQAYELTLDLAVTSNVFLPGHRIRLEVSSSNFPWYDRNTNTGCHRVGDRGSDRGHAQPGPARAEASEQARPSDHQALTMAVRTVGGVPTRCRAQPRGTDVTVAATMSSSRSGIVTSLRGNSSARQGPSASSAETIRPRH